MLAGCAGGSRSGSDQPGTQGVSSAAPGPAGQVDRKSLNSSSAPDLSAALRANDVSGPENWSQILLQFTPYPPGQAGAEKIAQVLAQFKADPDTTAKITNVVTP
ncbi:hypothetical protein GCM10009836_72580 [Pseudonocardia ailaonensis]|uniref:Uncharacterized protein n=2 Tax=Pseudonocardia ailaonensis TaxID=367279 RepID=A0ABN2NPJ2_9PSEU